MTFAPVALLLRLNNLGMRPSVRVSKAILLINLAIVGVTIIAGYVCLALQGVDWLPVWTGYGRAAPGVPPLRMNERSFGRSSLYWSHQASSRST